MADEKVGRKAVFFRHSPLETQEDNEKVTQDSWRFDRHLRRGRYKYEFQCKKGWFRGEIFCCVERSK
jgi:hypothetical protein